MQSRKTQTRPIGSSPPSYDGVPGGIPNYTLLERIGVGGFGEVWLATETLTGARRAVKIVPASRGSRADVELDGVRRYQRCAHDHRHLLSIYTVGQTAECFYYVMELGDADASERSQVYRPLTLRSVLTRSGRMDARAALQLIGKLADGVARLHREGIGHHDLKPENVLFVGGEPRIVDVGLVGEVFCAAGGTTGYMAPEGKADDGYALGKILYELLTGQEPADFPHLPAALVHRPTRELTAALQIANRAAHPDPAQRFHSVEDIVDAVQRALRRRTPRGRRAALAPTAAVALAVAVAARLSAPGHPTASGAAVRVLDHVPLPMTPEAWELGESQPPDPDSAFVSLPGGEMEPGCWHRYDIPSATRGWEFFVVDLRIVLLHPGGVFTVRVGAAPDGVDAVELKLQQQPGGMGAYVGFSRIDASGTRQGEQLLHLQPITGVEYCLRIATVGQDFVGALWPLSRANPTPMTMRVGGGLQRARARFVSLYSATDTARPRMRLLDAALTRLSAPLSSVDDPAFLPGEVVQRSGTRIKPGWPSTRPSEAGPIWGNLIAEPYDPVSSDAWRQIGAWSWVPSRASPNRERLMSGVVCTPFSKEQRTSLNDANLYQGMQILCFEPARFAEFDARLRVVLQDPARGEPRNPFASVSGNGSVGLLWAFQDQPDASCAWGEADAVSLAVEQAGDSSVCFTHIDCFRVSSLHDQVAYLEGLSSTNPPDVRTVPRETVFASNGFELRLVVRGNRRELYLNDEPTACLTSTTRAGEPAPTGRIGVFASRLLAIFESLEMRAVTP